MNETKLKARLLNSYSWYILIKEIGSDQAKELLKPQIINQLYPKSLQKSYTYSAGELRSHECPPM